MRKGAVMAERLVCTSSASSTLMKGDPEYDNARFWIEVPERPTYAAYRDGKALPVLMAEGWSILSITSTGGGYAIVVLRRDDK